MKGLCSRALSRSLHPAFRRVYAPKAVGGWGLQRASAASPLDACVLFSSVAALLGLGGQANYSAANCCLDALAASRHARGSAATSVQWGPWADVGMAAGQGVNARLQAGVIGLLSPAQGLAALGTSLLLPGSPVVAAIIVDWRRFLSGARDAPAFFRGVARAVASTSTEAVASLA